MFESFRSLNYAHQERTSFSVLDRKIATEHFFVLKSGLNPLPMFSESFTVSKMADDAVPAHPMNKASAGNTALKVMIIHVVKRE